MPLTKVSSAMIGGEQVSPVSFTPGATIFENAQSISANYCVTTGTNGFSAGPVTVASGITLTVPNGSTWVVV